MENDDKYKSKLDKDDLEKYETFKKIKEALKNKKPEEEKEFVFENGEISMIYNNFFYCSNNEEIYFDINSKIMKFLNKIKNTENYYFIHDESSLEDALKKTGIVNGILTNGDKPSGKIENYNTNNSKGSQGSVYSIGDMDVYDILNSTYDTIEEPHEVKVNTVFSEENLKNRFKWRTVSDLDFNFRYLDKDITQNKICYNETQNNWYGEIRSLYANNEKSYSYIFGPKEIGKTTILLKYLNAGKIPRLYFSLKILTNPKFHIKKWQKYAMYETIYIFKNKEQINEFREKLKDIPYSSNLMEFIYSYIKFVMDFLTNIKYTLKGKIIIVLDDYNEDLYDRYNVIEKIINYAKENKQKLHLCIIGEGKYINNKLYKFYSNEIIDFSGLYFNLSIENTLSNKYKILKIPKYYYKYKDSQNINNIQNIIIDNLANNFKKIKLSDFFILSRYLNIELDIRELKDDFTNIPFQYITINKIYNLDRGELVKLSFSFEIYQKIFDESIKGLMKLDNLKTKINLFNNGDFGKDGIGFEDIITEQLWNNTINFLQFPENNKLKVKKIYLLKDNKDDIRMNVDISYPIIIRQTVSTGKYYDLLLILKQNNKIYAIFIQIGLSKTGSDISTYLDNLILYYNKYIEGIKTLINQRIDSLGFMLIFEYNHQKKLMENKNERDGVGYCIKHNIDYLILKDYEFYKNLNDECSIQSFNVENKTLIFPEEEKNNLDISIVKEKFSDVCKDMFLLRNINPKISISEEDKSKIINYIKEKFDSDYDELDYAFNVCTEHEGFGDFGFIDSDNFDQINIFITMKPKHVYFGYNNKIFKIVKEKEKDTIQEIDMSQIASNKTKYNWDRYFLKRKRKLE